MTIAATIMISVGAIAIVALFVFCYGLLFDEPKRRYFVALLVYIVAALICLVAGVTQLLVGIGGMFG